MKESSGLEGALMKPEIPKVPVQSGDKICYVFYLFVCRKNLEALPPDEFKWTCLQAY